MDENEVLENEELESDNVNEIEESDDSEILTEINNNLLVLSSNQQTIYSSIQSLETHIETIETYNARLLDGISFLTNFTLFVFVFCFIIITAKFIKHLL